MKPLETTVEEVLREAIQIDPRYAPACEALARAIQLEGAMKDHESYI